MPSDSLLMLMLAVGIQKPADPSICVAARRVAGSLMRLAGVNWRRRGVRAEQRARQRTVQDDSARFRIRQVVLRKRVGLLGRLRRCSD